MIGASLSFPYKESMLDLSSSRKKQTISSSSDRDVKSFDSLIAEENHHRPGMNYCDVSEDETTQAVREMNFKISSQNHVIGDTHHANLNASSETLLNAWKKNKSKPEGSNSNQVSFSTNLNTNCACTFCSSKLAMVNGFIIVYANVKRVVKIAMEAASTVAAHVVEHFIFDKTICRTSLLYKPRRRKDTISSVLVSIEGVEE
ncbi:hypothetical protein Tco_1326668 [Tanacetum coccineum]